MILFISHTFAYTSVSSRSKVPVIWAFDSMVVNWDFLWKWWPISTALNTEWTYIWSLRVSTCQSSLFSKHFIGWKTQRGSSSVLLRQRKVILCCCETTFLILAELTYSLTYQIIVLPIPSIPDFVYIHFAQKIIWTVNACLHSNSLCFTLDLQSLWQFTHAWAHVKKHAKYFKWRTHCTTVPGSFTLTFASNCDCRMVFKNKFSRLLKTKN